MKKTTMTALIALAVAVLLASTAQSIGLPRWTFVAVTKTDGFWFYDATQITRLPGGIVLLRIQTFKFEPFGNLVASDPRAPKLQSIPAEKALRLLRVIAEDVVNRNINVGEPESSDENEIECEAHVIRTLHGDVLRPQPEHDFSLDVPGAWRAIVPGTIVAQLELAVCK
jgi:hypothetical protein